MIRLVLAPLLAFLVAASAAAQGKSYLIGIESIPPGASISISGKPYGTTPFRNKVPEGTHELVLTKEGYDVLTTTLKVERASYKKTFTYNLIKTIELPTLVLASRADDLSAEGAEVTIDGTPSGTLPLTTKLPAGRHFVELKKPGFVPYGEWVELSEGGSTTLTLTLTAEKVGAALKIEGSEGAQVFLDGALVGLSPVALEKLPPGRHLVQVKKEGFLDYSEWIELKEAEASSVTAALSPRTDLKKTGSLRVFTDNDPARVYVDGDLMAQETPMSVELQPGEHLIEVRKPGFERYEQAITVTQNAEQVVKVPLVATGQRPGTLRIISPLSDTEVFIDGTSVGPAPVLRDDLVPGQHFVVVRKPGFREFQATIELSAEAPVEVIAELAATGAVKVIANLSGAEIFLDGERLTSTTQGEGIPTLLENIPVGSHQVMVRSSGYTDALLDLKVVAGETAVADVTLTLINRRLPGPERRKRIATYSARPVETGDYATDVMVGIPHFVEATAITGAIDRMDVGVAVRIGGPLNEFHARVKYSFFDTPVAGFGVEGGVGGGFGPAFEREVDGSNSLTLSSNSFSTHLSALGSLYFKDVLAVTGRAGMLFYTDAGPAVNAFAEVGADGTPTRDQNLRDTAARLTLGIVAQLLVKERLSYNLILEGSPVGINDKSALGDGRRRRLMYDAALPNDPLLYARLGVTFKF